MKHRVVITGIGVLSASGGCSSSFWEALREGNHGFRLLESVDRQLLRFQYGAEIPSFCPENHFPPQVVTTLDRASQLAVVSARQAWEMSGLTLDEADREKTAVITGTGTGGIGSHDKGAFALYGEGRTRAHPLSVPMIMANAPTSQICMDLGLKGPSYSVVTACSSANNAIGQAFWLVREGIVDCAVTGGSEAPFSYLHLKGWEAMRVIAPDLCRPFSAERKGMMLGEGAAMLVLETLEKAQQRDATILAEVVGYGCSSDASHLTSPDVNGAARAMEAALADAGLADNKRAVGYVNAHGTGTQVNDAMETRAIRQVFGDHADQLAVSSTKSMHGHALGASSALEAVATVLALKNGILPPTANYTTPDPACDLDVIPNQAREQVVDYAVSNAFAFGGLNAVLVFRRWSDEEQPKP